MRDPEKRPVVNDDVAHQPPAESGREGHHKNAHRIELFTVSGQNTRKGKGGDADDVGERENSRLHGVSSGAPAAQRKIDPDGTDNASSTFFGYFRERARTPVRITAKKSADGKPESSVSANI